MPGPLILIGPCRDGIPLRVVFLDIAIKFVRTSCVFIQTSKLADTNLPNASVSEIKWVHLLTLKRASCEG